MSKIPILVDAEPDRTREPTLGGFGRKPPEKEVDAQVIKSGIQNLTGALTEVLTDLKQVGAFRLKQVAVTLEINAEGKVFLVAKAGAKGGITLTFEA